MAARSGVARFIICWCKGAGLPGCIILQHYSNVVLL